MIDFLRIRIAVVRPHIFLLLGLVGIITIYAFYALFLSHQPFIPDADDYSQLLGQAFLSGHTYLDMSPDHRVADSSYFNGKYYLYWGPVPVLVIWVPIKLLTGISVSNHFMAFLLASIGTCSLAVLLYLIAIRQGAVSVPGIVFAILSLTFGTWLPFVLRDARIYEIAVIGAYAFSALGSLLLWLFWDNRQRWYMCLALASLCFGLAVGCRISHVLNGIFLVLSLIVILRTTAGRTAITRSIFWTFLPWLACIAGLAIYNYERFGSPFENGWQYAIGNAGLLKSGLIPFTLTPILLHSYLYLLHPLSWQFPGPFPFIDPAIHYWREMTVPWQAQSLGRYYEPVFGLFTNSPFSLFCLFFLYYWHTTKNWLSATRLVISAITLYGLSLFALMALFFAASARYMIDFSPWLMMAAGVYYLHLLKSCKNPRYRNLLLWLGGVCAIYTVLTGAMSGYCGYFRCSPKFQ